MDSILSKYVCNFDEGITPTGIFALMLYSQDKKSFYASFIGKIRIFYLAFCFWILYKPFFNIWSDAFE